jgi:hypothetical protein
MIESSERERDREIEDEERERENDDGIRQNYSFDLEQTFSRDGGGGENCISETSVKIIPLDIQK